MKPFLGIDLTADKKNEQINGSEFLIQKTSTPLTDALETCTEKAEATIERSKLPLPIRVIGGICGIAALLVAAGIVKAGVSLAAGYQNAPWLYWAVGICAVVWLFLWLWDRKKSKTVLETEESTQTLSNLEGTANAVYAELGVPADAKDVDILFFFYKIKDGQIKVHEKAMQLSQYFNPEFKIYTDTDYLYLANLEGKYAIPRSSMTGIRTVKKHIRILQWNKEENLSKGIYKQYKLTEDQYGCVHCKCYHILEINAHDETYGIYIPCYELPVFEELTGLKVQDEI